MRRAVLPLLTVLMCAAAEARTAGQAGPPTAQPARDPAGRGIASRPSTGTATISGTVVGLSSDQPIADASVSIYAPAFADGRKSTTTDNQGRFVFADLAAGRYTIGATKPGLVNVTYGQRKVGGAGRAISIVDGEHRDIRLQLPRPSVITGVVIDERGNPVVNASVRALRFSTTSSFIQLTSSTGLRRHAECMGLGRSRTAGSSSAACEAAATVWPRCSTWSSARGSTRYSSANWRASRFLSRLPIARERC